MSDGDLLLAAILANPADDTPRLVYADWLDENGEPERAEFIRVQVAMAQETRVTYKKPLRKKLKRLLRGAISFRTYPWLNYWMDEIKFGIGGQGWEFHAVPVVPSAHFSRGFISRVTCSWPDWRDSADAILRAHPVETVRFTTWPTWEFLDNGLTQLDGSSRLHWVPRGEAHDHSRAGIATMLLDLEWPTIVFELPIEAG